MAHTISVSHSSSPARSLHSVRILRLVLGLTILFGILVAFLGLGWDIQWHGLIGRDRTLIPPHLVILSGVTLSGIAALLAVLIEKAWVRRNPDIAPNSVRFAGTFHGALGAYVAGFAALDAAIAFPLDQYWHALYGIDVALWTPFHMMLITGMGLTALGAAYMLLSVARLAADALWLRRIGYLAAIVAFGTTLIILSVLLISAVEDRRFVSLGGVTLNLFPLLSGLLGAWLLVAAAYAIPWRRVATSIALVYFSLGLLTIAVVPPAMRWLMASEHLSYRPDVKSAHLRAENFSLLAMMLPLAIIVGALLIDVCFWFARRRGWSGNKLLMPMAVAALIGSIPMVALDFDVSVQLVQLLGTPGLLITILLGALGAFIGTWFGQRTGSSLQQMEGKA
jgi:hypothetical protein